jgi:hypothetical protein
MVCRSVGASCQYQNICSSSSVRDCCKDASRCLRESVELIRSILEQVIRFHLAKGDSAAAGRAGKVFAYLAESAILAYVKRISAISLS